jgi:HEAT repeat protein/putative zinc finger protein
VSEQPHNEAVLRCEEIEKFAVLYTSDELDPAVRAALEAHTAQCSTCAAVVSREARLHQEIASFDQPADSLDRSGLLLAQCRSELSEALDDQQARVNQPGWRAVFSPVAWWTVLRDTLVYHPAMSMAALVVVGFLAGVAGQRLRVTPPASPRPVMTASAAVKPSPKLTEQQLQNAGSANIAWVTPSGSRTPTVQVQLMSQAPMNIVGPPDDADVQRALCFVLANGQRFDSSARMESLEVLRTRCADPEVRRAVCAAALSDGNPGVRLKALEALHGFEQDSAVQQTLMGALQNDDNSGVRVEAVNLLISGLRAESSSGAVDPNIVTVLRNRLRNDPDNYIRLQSAAALRQLSAGR